MVELGVLGERLRGLRAERETGLQALAEASGVSVSMLSAIERGEKAPTVVVLSRIADGLGISLVHLLEPVAGERVVVRRAAEQDTVDEPGGWRRTVLTPVIPGVNFEWIHSTLPPGCAPAGYPPYAAGSHEFVVVESGTLWLTVDGATYRLAEGDSIYFPGDAEVSYANQGEKSCSYHVAALVMRPRTAGTRYARSR